MVFSLAIVTRGSTPAVASLDPPLWHVVDATDPPQRPDILDGQRSLWCGKYDPTWVLPANQAGIPNCTYQILYIDTGSHAADYNLTLTMNVSTELEYDFLYLIGGGGDAVDPIGANSVQLDQAAATGASGSARLLVSWNGSIKATTPGAALIDARGGPVAIVGGGAPGDYFPLPTTVTTTIKIPAQHRALYFLLTTDPVFSTEDGLWPLGHGAVLDDVSTDDHGIVYDEQVAAGGTDAFGGTVLVGSAGSPVVSARTADPPPTVTLFAPITVVGEGGTASVRVRALDCQSISTLTADLSSLPAGNDAVFVLDPPIAYEGRIGRLTWHPAVGDLGVYHVTFTTSNDVSASATAEIRVVRTGTIAGSVTGTCGGVAGPLAGVPVDVFTEGAGDLVGTGVTDGSGHYSILGVPAANCTVSLVTPLGYSASSSEIPVTVVSGQTVAADFALSCIAASGKPASSGSWKHEFGVATGGNGTGQYGAGALCSFLDMIESHFNGNVLNQVVVYDAPANASCSVKLEIAKGLLNLGGSPAPIEKARQQLMALLLNVAANNLRLVDVISKDGATVSQAITYCDNLIDNPSGDRTVAAAIAEKINGGQKVNAGVIPLGTQKIAYARGGKTLEFSVRPNPSRGARVFSFVLDSPTRISLGIYDLAGRRVATVYEGPLGAGRHDLRWEEKAVGGALLRQGFYFARLMTGMGAHTLKLVQAEP